ERLREVKYNHKAWGSITAGNLRGYDDDELRAMSASYGLTQIMGYHCVWLGCSVADLKGEYHLQWAVAWMIRHYGTEARAGKWAECFRIHNTGRPDGRTSRADYVQRGLVRMQYYQEWAQKEGRL
ncbi:MAG: hypothetical protein KDK34_19145, partial [Leptospiraceae bacterium]|nr:hypothetical protein [Leptospiraceae bacterium]